MANLALFSSCPLTPPECRFPAKLMEYDTLSSDDVVFSDQDEVIDYEDLETTIQHGDGGSNPKTRIEWAQRLLISSRVLVIVHIVLNTRLIVFAWTMYNMLGRFFIMLPLALEAILSLLFVAIGTSPITLFTTPIMFNRSFATIYLLILTPFGVVVVSTDEINESANEPAPKPGSQAFWMGRRTTFKRCTLCKFSAAFFYAAQIIWTIIFLSVMSKILKVLIFEPTPVGPTPNVDWSWLWSSFGLFAALSAMQMIVSLALIGITVAHWWLTFKTIPEYEGLKPKRSLLARLSYLFTTLAYFLLFCAALVMFGMALGSAFNLGGHFGRPTASSYSGCDPIDPTSCTYPFPSSHFLTRDNTSHTGYRVNFGVKSLPKTMDGGRISPTYWNELDGFSTIAPLLFYLNGATNTSFVPHNNISRSLSPFESSTIIVNVQTGKIMPHWAELDAVDPLQPSVVVQPASPLDHASHYLVIVKNVRDIHGNVIARTKDFDALMGDDKKAWKHDADRWTLYHSTLIPVIANLGIAPNDVQLAWDFVTVSEYTNHGRYEQMRDYALNSYIPRAEIVKDVNNEAECLAETANGIGRSITAKISVPNFLVNKQFSRGGFLPRHVTKGTSAAPLRSERAPIVQNGEKFVYVQIQVPCSLQSRQYPQAAAKIVQYGHGLFGTRNEVKSGWIGPWLHKTKMLFFAADWLGMAKFDRLKIGKIILSDLSSFASVPETTLQGWANKALILKAMLPGGALSSLLPLNSGVSLVNPQTTDAAYYGISQGGVIGGGYAASSRHTNRVALGVPGSPFALLLTRSHDFDSFHALFTLSLYEWRDIRLALSLMQQLWDQGESAGWLSYMNRDTPASVPKKSVLIQSAHGDAQVTILGARIMARAFNASNLIPAPESPIFGLTDSSLLSAASMSSNKVILSDEVRDDARNEAGDEASNESFDSVVSTSVVSALTEYKYQDVPPSPFTNTPPSESWDTHECVRREATSQAQIFEFFTTGNIRQTCKSSKGCSFSSCYDRTDDDLKRVVESNVENRLETSWSPVDSIHDALVSSSPFVKFFTAPKED